MNAEVWFVAFIAACITLAVILVNNNKTGGTK